MMKRMILAAMFSLALACTMQAQTHRSLSILGDSYSTFTDFVVPDTNEVWYCEANRAMTDVRQVEQTWWHQLARMNGLKLCVNNSYSGATISSTGYNGADYTPRSFVTRLKYLGNPDVIAVFGATNDSWAGSPIGDYKYGDWTQEDLKSFRPAMACLLDGLKKHYPNVDIYFLVNCELKDEITSSIQVVCDHYAIPYILLHDIDKQDGHPTIKGMTQIAEQVRDFVK